MMMGFMSLGSTIYYAVTKINRMICSIYVGSDLPLSDHFPVFFLFYYLATAQLKLTSIPYEIEYLLTGQM